MSVPTIMELRQDVDATTSDAERLRALLALGEELTESQPGEAVELSAAADELARQLGDDLGAARSIAIAGAAHVRSGAFELAIDELERARVAFKQLRYERGLARVALEMGTVHRRRGDSAASMLFYDDAVAHAESAGDASMMARIRGHIGLAFHSLGDMQRAEEHARAAIDLGTRVGDRHAVAFATRNLSHVSITTGNRALALEQCSTAIALWTELDDRASVARAQAACATIYRELGEGARAIEMHRAALAHEVDAGNRAIAIYEIGLVFTDLAEYDQAIEYLRSAMSTFEELGHSIGLGKTLQALGVVHGYLNEKQIALDHFHRAIDLFKESGHRSEIGQGLMNAGAIYHMLNESETARTYLEKAREIFESLSDPMWLSLTLGALANVHRDLTHDFPRALDYYHEALTHATNAKADVAAVGALINLGMLYARPSFDGHDAAIAEQYFEQAITLAERSDRKHKLSTAHEQLAELYRARGDWKAAHHHLAEFHALEKQVDSHAAHEKTGLLEHRRQLATIEHEHAVERAMAREAEAAQRVKADEAERELGNATLQLLAQTELLRTLRSDLQKILRKLPPTEPAVRELRERIKSLASEKVDWERFDVQFRSVHPEFIRNLTARAPGLTPTELRICTMLRMNLKSHEIAQIFSITEAGVDFHRANIRRKLGLRRSEKLPIVIGAL